VAGLVGATLTGAVIGATVLGVHPQTWGGALAGGIMGAVVGAGAQVGDLIESVLKREAGVKDSGTLLPGHGGVFDRFDALLVTLPLAYFLLNLVKA
jgi:phosphatidate cytidylyltransferase